MCFYWSVPQRCQTSATTVGEVRQKTFNQKKNNALEANWKLKTQTKVHSNVMWRVISWSTHSLKFSSFLGLGRKTSLFNLYQIKQLLRCSTNRFSLVLLRRNKLKVRLVSKYCFNVVLAAFVASVARSVDTLTRLNSNPWMPRSFPSNQEFGVGLYYFRLIEKTAIVYMFLGN